MLSWVNIDIYSRWIQLKKQHIGRVPTMEQDVAIGLFNGMGNQLVANNPAIDEEVL